MIVMEKKERWKTAWRKQGCRHACMDWHETEIKYRPTDRQTDIFGRDRFVIVSARGEEVLKRFYRAIFIEFE